MRSLGATTHHAFSTALKHVDPRSTMAVGACLTRTQQKRFALGFALPDFGEPPYPLHIMWKLSCRCSARAGNRAPRSRPLFALARFDARAFAVVALLVLATLSASATEAQTWSASRDNPTLWQIVSIDRSGEQGWPYGREDVAGDGLDTFAAAEAALDLRTVYADADADRLWLRAHVASPDEPTETLRAFFFVDSDARNATGGPAHGSELADALGDDPTAGGYELAIAVRGNGDELSVWQWDTAMRKWVEKTDFRPAEVRIESGSARDPLLVGSPSHGYVQLELAHALSGLTQSCGGSLFVRLTTDGAPPPSDDAPEEIACDVPEDAYGDPVLLRPDGCDSNADCPAGGRCREGICLFAYECSNDADCPSGYTCSSNQCVRVVSGACEDATDCEGLVCEGSRCVACAESGAGACAAGLLCAPNGTCVDPDDGARGGRAGAEGKVRGGAFSCTAGATGTGSAAWTSSLLALLLLCVRTRKRAKSRSQNGVAARVRQP